MNPQKTLIDFNRIFIEPGLKFSLDSEILWSETGDFYVHHDIFQLPNQNYIGIAENEQYGPIPEDIDYETLFLFEISGYPTYPSSDFFIFPWVGDEIIEWDENGYVLEIGRHNKIAKVQWIVNGSKGNSSLRVRINPKLPYKNRFIRWAAWNLYIKFRLQSYINNVLDGFEYYIETNDRVESNKFGKHAWFS